MKAKQNLRLNGRFCQNLRKQHACHLALLVAGAVVERDLVAGTSVFRCWDLGFPTVSRGFPGGSAGYASYV